MTAREPLDLDAVLALAVATPAGPWTADGWEVYGPSPDRRWIAESHDPGSADDGAGVAAFIAAARTALPALVAGVRALADCVVKATEYGSQDGGFVASYILPTGPIHRAIPLLQELGVTVRPGFDGRAAALPERTAVPGEPLPPIPDSAYAPGAIPVGRAVIVDPDNPTAVETELRRVAAETGEPYEIVRDLYDAMVACGEERLIERDQHELSQTEFVASDHGGKRWWVLRGPSGAISLTAAVVPADAKLPPLSTAMMVRDRDGSALFPDCFTAHRAGTATCPALPGGCDADGEAISGAAKALESWAATGNDDDVIRDALVDVYRRELLGGDR